MLNYFDCLFLLFKTNKDSTSECIRNISFFLTLIFIMFHLLFHILLFAKRTWFTAKFMIPFIVVLELKCLDNLLYFHSRYFRFKKLFDVFSSLISRYSIRENTKILDGNITFVNWFPNLLLSYSIINWKRNQTDASY